MVLLGASFLVFLGEDENQWLFLRRPNDEGVAAAAWSKPRGKAKARCATIRSLIFCRDSCVFVWCCNFVSKVPGLLKVQTNSLEPPKWLVYHKNADVVRERLTSSWVSCVSPWEDLSPIASTARFKCVGALRTNGHRVIRYPVVEHISPGCRTRH